MKPASFLRHLMLGLVLTVLLANQTLAKIDKLINPFAANQDFATKNVSPEASEFVFRRGAHHIGGGVFIGGTFSFFIVNEGISEPVLISELKLERTVDGGLAILHGHVSYEIDFHRGVECPLARVIERGGDLLYSIPPIEDTEELAKYGMVRFDDFSSGPPSYIAREFSEDSGIEFVPLLENMDFFQVQTVWVSSEFRSPRDPADDAYGGMFARYAKELSSAIVGNPHDFGKFSYFNIVESDLAQAFLSPEEGLLRLSSMPLRIRWIERGKGTEIFAIQILSYNALVDRPLWNPEDPVLELSQLDALTMFNFTSLLKTFQFVDPARFAQTRAMLCN